VGLIQKIVTTHTVAEVLAEWVRRVGQDAGGRGGDVQGGNRSAETLANSVEPRLRRSLPAQVLRRVGGPGRLGLGGQRNPTVPPLL